MKVKFRTMKKYKPEKKETHSKPKKLHQCGHVTVIERDGAKHYEKCDVLTSQQTTLTSGMKVFICRTHERLYK